MENQRMASPSLDRISLLPDCILELILVLLPLQAVVRTSVLSRRWKSLWTNIPELVFDKSFFQSISDKGRVIPIIQNTIFRNCGPLFDLTFSLDGVSSFDIGQPVHRWKFASPFYESFELYELLSLDELHSLKRLHLETCLFTFYGGLRGFNMLTNLSLYEVNIDGGDLSNLVSKCPLLDTLTLISPPFCYYLNLVAPNLRVFCCDAFLLGLSFDFTPRLEKLIVSLDDTNSDEPEDIVVPFGSIPSIKYMELDGCFLKYMNRDVGQRLSRCQDALNHLTYLKLNDVSFREMEVGQNVLSLIRRSPNLERILISTCSHLPNFEPAVGVWPIGGLSDVLLNGLQCVCVANVTGKHSEVEFIRMLLSKSPMLELMAILLHPELTKEETLGVEEEIAGFLPVSSEIIIKFYEPPSGN